MEKYLKEVLVFGQVPFPKIHDLEKLVRLLPPSFALPISVHDLAALSPYAVNARYPDDWRLPDRQECERFHGLAEKVRAAVSTSIVESCALRREIF